MKVLRPLKMDGESRHPPQSVSATLGELIDAGAAHIIDGKVKAGVSRHYDHVIADVDVEELVEKYGRDLLISVGRDGTVVTYGGGKDTEGSFLTQVGHNGFKYLLKVAESEN